MTLIKEVNTRGGEVRIRKSGRSGETREKAKNYQQKTNTWCVCVCENERMTGSKESDKRGADRDMGVEGCRKSRINVG